MADISEDYIKRQLTLLRAAENDANEMAAIIRRIHKRILSKVGSSSDIEKIRKLIEEELRSFYYAKLPDELKIIAADVIISEYDWNNKVMLGEEARKITKKKTNEILKKTRRKGFQGHRIETWVRAQYRGSAREIIRTLEDGYREGVSIDNITRNVQTVIGRKEADVKTITRAHFMLNANAAKEEVFRDNEKLIEYIVWSSTLDSRTTPLICGVRDQQRYTQKGKEPIDHPYEWGQGPGLIHWNCRSASYPKLKDVPLNAPRPSFGPGSNYTRGDNKTRTGRVRKPNKAAREKGIYEFNRRTNRTSYESWLKEQSRKNIDFVSDVLGSKEKARQFRDGDKSLFDLGMESPVANPINRSKL